MHHSSESISSLLSSASNNSLVYKATVCASQENLFISKLLPEVEKNKDLSVWRSMWRRVNFLINRKEFPDRDSMKKYYVYKGSHLPTYLPGHLVINLTAR